MLALAVCVLAFIACYFAGRRSLGHGLAVLLAFGYFYGILRANLLTTFSHFIFDAGMIGLYVSFKWQTSDPEEKQRTSKVLLWTTLLVLWPLLLVVMPFQPLLISLVGLRGNIYFIPLLVLGSRLKNKDLITLSVGMALLDLVAVGFGAAEYFLGVPRFFPVSPVTELIYSSGDVEGGFLRIPATFSSAHAFGGTMISTLPYLVGLWTTSTKRLHRMLALAAIPAALMGMLMSATRSNFLIGCMIVVFFVLTAKVKGRQRIFFMVMIGVVAAAALTNVRFQRFKSLSDTDYVSERVAGSVNRGFWEILIEYPMGNGLGGGGTSIPYFLQGQVRNPIGMENEYARILSEQGVIGLLVWLGCVIWFFSRYRIAFAKTPWANTRKLLWGMSAFGFGTAWIGTGLLTAIPGTLMLMVGVGWAVTQPLPDTAASPRLQRPPLRRKVYAEALQ
jgi:hypothetical protein